MSQQCVTVTQLGSDAPVMVPIPGAGRYSIVEDADGVRWLTVRRWWGRTVLHWPVEGPVSAGRDFE
ncbi:hypothetical protein OHB26_39295 (plasmid) [Nocardia sp. NBC_01503]|uniref:hypothetical protein n=1 Tax=Nocardia sp. NBC_01503 TaxID=2975997 RepID=UPI002E7C2A09|nr:hypothetical protein [Nocardia sp. NBC_01503]WTL36725.1 hypothetical protein OHB26_39295 [Nocardia sp. NBC_01503]